MRRFKENMDRFYNRLDKRWSALSISKQRQYTFYFFVGYLTLTAVVIAKIWYDTKQSKNEMVIEYIKNPVLKKNESPASLQDSLPSIFKHPNYERK